MHNILSFQGDKLDIVFLGYQSTKLRTETQRFGDLILSIIREKYWWCKQHRALFQGQPLVYSGLCVSRDPISVLISSLLLILESSIKGVFCSCVASLLLCINWHLRHSSFSISSSIGLLLNFTADLNNTALSQCSSIPVVYKTCRLKEGNLSITCPVHVLLNLSAEILNSALSECCLVFPDTAMSHSLQCPSSIW